MHPARQKAQEGLALLKEAILGLVAEHKDGVSNSDIARELGLESDFEGNQKNYLSWSVLGLLVNSKRIRTEKRGERRYYFPA